jgi:ribosomal protein L44E
MVKRLTSGAGNQMRAKASNLAKSNKPASLTYKIENIRTKAPTAKRGGPRMKRY